VFFYSLFGVIFDKFWGMIKTTAPYQLPQYKILELVVESDPISGSDNYDPIKINNIRPASYKFIRKVGIMQENLPTEQLSNIRTQNNRNHNNQSVAAEEVSAEEFHYEELTTEQVAALHQKRCAQNVDDSLNRWGIMTSNGSESLNNMFRIATQLSVCAIIENTWHKCVEWFYKR
jgi:hypothetical protein